MIACTSTPRRLPQFQNSGAAIRRGFALGRRRALVHTYLLYSETRYRHHYLPADDALSAANLASAVRKQPKL